MVIIMYRDIVLSICIPYLSLSLLLSLVTHVSQIIQFIKDTISKQSDNS